MGKKKLQRFEENRGFSNLVQPVNSYPPADHPLKGNWNRYFFRNDRPIVLELGCGRGEYTISLAEKFPEKNFIGIDWKGARLWRGAKTAFDGRMLNAGFLRIQIQNICAYFGPGEVDEIWITFPDPQLTKPGERKRLTSPNFLDRYRSIMPANGIINLKTDSREFFEYTTEVVQSQHLSILDRRDDLYATPPGDLLSIKTTYEKIWLKKGSTIYYIRFSIQAKDDDR